LWLCPIRGQCLKAKPLYGSIQNTRSGAKSTDASSAARIDAGTEDFQVPATRELLSKDWKKAHQLEANKLYVPRVDNMESGDAFYLVPIAPPSDIQADRRSASSAVAAGRGREQAYMLVVLQVTVAASHPVKSNGLVDILDIFPEALHSKISKKALVFVKDAHGTFDKEQSIVSKNDSVMAPNKLKQEISSSMCAHTAFQRPHPHQTIPVSPRSCAHVVVCTVVLLCSAHLSLYSHFDHDVLYMYAGNVIP
jgi:hypothetical protein